MPLRSENFAEALLPAIYNFFNIGLNMRPSLIPSLYSVRQSQRSKEEHVGLGGAGTEAWDVYNMTGQVGEIDYDQTYTSTFTHVTYPARLNIQREWLEDVQYTMVSDYARKVGISAGQKREKDAASVFNNAFSSSFTGPDSVSLCNASHPANPNKSGTQSNTGTSALTKANVSTTRQAMMAYEDDSGNLLGVTPNILLVPPELEDTALETVRSVLDPTSANNTINPQAGRFQVVPWHYLTDANNWFMIDSVWMMESLIWYDRVNLEFIDVREDAVNIQVDARMRYSYGWTDWRWIYGHAVT